MHPSAAYLYVLRLDGPSLAWEYLRRNPAYAQEWQTIRRHCHGMDAAHWGLRYYEDPLCDARCIQPAWLPCSEYEIRIVPDEYLANDACAFSIWDIPGRKTISHSGDRLLLAGFQGCRFVRLSIARNLADGMAYAYAVRAGLKAHCRWRAIEEQVSALDAQHVPTAMGRPDRIALAHMHSLKVLDGVQAGISQRDVACGLFGFREVEARWAPDSELRAQLRYLVKRGRSYMEGDYRRLLQWGVRA